MREPSIKDGLRINSSIVTQTVVD